MPNKQTCTQEECLQESSLGRVRNLRSRKANGSSYVCIGISTQRRSREAVGTERNSTLSFEILQKERTSISQEPYSSHAYRSKGVVREEVVTQVYHSGPRGSPERNGEALLSWE